MATVVFYEKPGCGNNTRQKRLLAEAGHELIVHDLLTMPWTETALRPFFGTRPVAEWFNRASPRVKAGEVVPENASEAEAIAWMLADPLLIRRPLMQVGERREAGFDSDLVAAWIGLEPPRDDSGAAPDLEKCRRSDACPTPEAAP